MIINAYTLVELAVTEYFPVAAHLSLVLNNEAWNECYFI